MLILPVKKSSDFKKISNSGKKFHAKTLILLQNPTDEFYFQNKLIGKNAVDFCRLGLTASKKIGGAVQRNRAKRRLREACRKLLKKLAKNHHDYVIIAKEAINAASFEDILRDLEFCLKRIDTPKKL
jgi:ribonuclease P protein component